MTVEESLFQFYQKNALELQSGKSLEGSVAWQSPSNIAIVKYWGKHGNQLPKNPSVSFTLSHARSETSIRYHYKPTSGVSLDFFFEGMPNAAFGQKILTFLQSILPVFPFLNHLHLSIESKNTFPHSSGIASSASSMSALVMCLMEIEKQISNFSTDTAMFLRKASYFSRLGSGSAARSVFPYAGLWGKTDEVPESSDEFAIPLAQILHPVFKTFRDSILIISSGTKPVSSRAGHALMEGNPFAVARYEQANKNTGDLLNALKTGDLEAFIDIAEAEALQLHALMMTSKPSFILMQPESLAAISALRAFRNETGIPVSFTLDAGPNLHVLYPENYSNEVTDFIRNELLHYCQNQSWIDDCVGSGPSPIALNS
jgi:diphosphomevalonate decarboxylase